MLRLTLHQMRTGWARLLAAGIAIMLGAGFVAASLLAGNVLTSATQQSVTAQYRGADLVASGVPFTDATVDAVQRIDGVQDTHLIVKSGMLLDHAGRTEWALLGVRPLQDSMLVGAVESGTAPASPDEIALTASTAKRLGADVGDRLTVTVTIWSWDDETGDAAPTDQADTFTVTALLADATNFFNYTADGLITSEAMRTLAPESAESGELAIAVSPGADSSDVADRIQGALGTNAAVFSVDELAETAIRAVSNDVNPFTALLLAFAGIALVVAVLVIGNTFSVLVAQRTRLLAMLRTIGATRGQIRRSVLLEAALLGVVSAVAGLAVGWGVIAGAVTFLSSKLPGIDLWRGSGITTGIAVGTIAVGVVATLIAGWVPARAATRVKPLAALRPEPVAVGTTAGKVRAAVAIASVVVGGGLLAGGVLLASTIGSTGGSANAVLLIALTMGIFGGFISVFGVLFGAVFLVGSAVRLAGRVFGRGATARLAVENSIRNPRRTAATTNALFIGVALVMLMATGAATAKATLEEGLSSYFPVDVQVMTVDGEALTPGQIEAVSRIDGIAASSMAATDYIALNTAADGTGYDVWASVAAPENADALADPSLITDLKPGEIAVDSGKSSALEAEIGDTVYATLSSAEDMAAAEHTALTLGQIMPGGNLALTLPETLREIAPDAAVNEMWLKLDPDANAVSTVRDIQDALSDLQETDPQAPITSVTGTAVEKSTFGEVIDTMLLVVLALLAVAIVIALVGVANTLSLSVIERRRESATLRALGLTKKQLRGMLAIEGVLIALVGAVVGVLGGLAYGWAGSLILLSGIGNVQLTVPWTEIGWTVVIAVAAGLVASVLPSRSAVKVPPVAALAEE